MYTTTRLDTKGCENVEINVFNRQNLDNEPEINLNITCVVANTNTHIVSEIGVSLSPDQWRDVVYKINNALKESEVYANKVGV